MWFLRPGLAGLALVMLLAMVFTPAYGQGGAPASIASRLDALLVTLGCPEPAADLAVAIDDAPAYPSSREALGAAPVAVALVVERSELMGAPGTPGHSRLGDAAQLARVLLALAPLGAPLTLVAAGDEAEVVLPLTTDRPAAALDALAPSPAAAGAPGEVAPGSPVAGGTTGVAATAQPRAGVAPVDLTAAIALGAGQLDEAPPGPRAIVVLAAADGHFALEDEQAPAARLLFVGLGEPGATGEGDGLAGFAARLGATYAAYASGEIAALPALRRDIEGRLRPLLAPGERLGLTLPPVGPGPHLLTVTGCGAPLAVAFDGAPGALWLGALAGAAALALSLGAWPGAPWHRAGGTPMSQAPPATTEARLLAASAITTARRAWAPAAIGGLRAVLWDSRGRRAVALEGRHWTIGSDPGCALRAEGEGIAPLHARLSSTGDGLTITDLEGAGGTRIGLVERVLAPGMPTPLAEGELVVLGRSLRLMVERVSADAAGEL